MLRRPIALVIIVFVQTKILSISFQWFFWRAEHWAAECPTSIEHRHRACPSRHGQKRTEAIQNLRKKLVRFRRILSPLYLAWTQPLNFLTISNKQGILANGTLVKVMDNQYRRNGPAKQYYALGTNTVMSSIIFRVLSNHGNVKYTCIYRIHLYGNTRDVL